MQLMYLLCDKDRKFGMRLAEYLERQKEFCYPLMLFSEKSELMRYLSACHDKGMKIIVVSAEYADEIEDKEKYRRVFKICSSAGEAADEDSFFRYMGASKIMTRLLSGTVRKVNALPENPRVIGFYGPVKRIGQTSSAISLCCLLMEKGKVLYVSMEGNSGFASLYGREAEADITQLICYEQRGKEKFMTKLDEMTVKLGNLCMINPARNPFCLREVSKEEWLCFLGWVKEQYDFLVLDISEYIDGIPDILRTCDYYFSLSGEDMLSKAKEAEFEAALRKMEYEDLLKKRRRLKVPRVEEQIPFDRIAFSIYPEIIKDLLQGEFGFD